MTQCKHGGIETIMTIIVTGGAGFIGSNFIFHMLKEHPEYRIICLADCHRKRPTEP